MSKLNSFMIDCVYATSAALTVRRNVGNTFLFAVDFCCPHSIQGTHTHTHTETPSHSYFVYILFQFQFICVFSPFRMCTQHFSTVRTGREKDSERERESGSKKRGEAACRRCIELSLNYAAVQSYGLSFLA